MDEDTNDPGNVFREGFPIQNRGTQTKQRGDLERTMGEAYFLAISPNPFQLHHSTDPQARGLIYVEVF